MPGPAPDPNALRRDRKDDVGWVSLPAAGRLGVAPVWPLEGHSDREAVLWESLWAKPQALLWEKNGQLIEVALYVRRLTEAELPDSPVTLTMVVAKLADSLLLTMPAMFRAHVKITDDELSVKRTAPVAVARLSARDRAKAAASGSR